MAELTPRQREIYQYLVQHVSRKGYPPTLQEMCDHFGWKSKNAAAGHVRYMRRKGYVKHSSGKCRTLLPIVNQSTYSELCAALADVILERVKCE